MTLSATKTEVDRAMAGRRVELILAQIDDLPTLPEVALRLLSLTAADDSSIYEIVELIESDASLTAAVLRQVRRADRGVRGETLTVWRAVTLLGLNAVRNIALSVQLFDALGTNDGANRTQTVRRELWRHNLAVACVSEMLGERIGSSPLAGEAFVCGLLHDIGKIAFDVCLPKSYARVLEQARRRRRCICDVEQEYFGLDHTVVGKRLVSRWRLPQPIVECIWLHHVPPEGLPSTVASPQLLQVVYLADQLVRREGIGLSDFSPLSDIEESAGRLQLLPIDLEQIIETLPSRMERFDELFGLDESPDQAVIHSGLSEANRRLARLNAELLRTNQALKKRSHGLASLQRFLDLSEKEDGTGEVCAAGADAFRFLLGAERTITFFHPARSSCTFLGAAQTADFDADSLAQHETEESSDHTAVAALRSLLVADDVIDQTLKTEMLQAGRTDGSWRPAPAAMEELWRHAFGASAFGAEGPLWLLPISTEGNSIAGVLVAEPFMENRRLTMLERLRAADDGVRVLSVAFGLALGAAAARASSERLAEDLLNVNRRLLAAQQQNVQNRSLSMIAAMAAGAAHELNNPLSVIAGRAQMALSTCQDEDIARSLRTILEHTHRAGGIVTDLMRFAKPEPPQPQVRPLAEVLEALSQRWRQAAGLTDRQIQVSAADAELTVFADSKQLDELLDAVVANAVEATDRSSARIVIHSPSSPSDETVRLVVQDNGAGMTPEVLSHALDPFFSSRAAGRGRGLGLSNAYRLAQINGGNLWLESSPGKGTTVTVELPAPAKPAEQA